MSARFTPSPEEQRQAAAELIEEHRVVEEVASFLAISGRNYRCTTQYPERIRRALLDSLLIRSRSLLDFYWRDLESSGPGRAQETDALAADFLGSTRTARMERWKQARRPVQGFVVQWWDPERIRVAREVAHLTYRRTQKPVRERGQRFWRPDFPWALVVLSGKAFEEALPPGMHDDLRQRLHGVFSPFFAERSLAECVAHVALFFEQQAPTA